MTRHQTIEKINSALQHLPDERLDALATLAEAWTQPTVYSSLPESETSKIEAALDELNRGEGLAWDDVRAGLDHRLKAAGA